MKVTPLHDRVLVKRLAKEEKTKGGIIIPDSQTEKPAEATVVSVGPGRRAEDGTLIEMDVKKGDLVLFAKYSGSEIKLDGEEHLILREDEVLAVIVR